MPAITKELEEVVEVVSDRLADLAVSAINALTGGDGIPFDWDEMSEEEQIENYKLLRYSPDAFFRYMEDKTKGFIQKLQDNGLDEEIIHSLRPYEIVLTAVINWSYNMEQKLGKEKLDAVSSSS